MKNLLVILKNSPYRTECSKLALNLAITFATFDQKINILIIGDGCFQLHPDQNTKHSHHRNHLKTLKSLSLYDIENIYIESTSLENSGFDSDNIDEKFTIITNEFAKKLITDADHIFGF